MNTVVVGTLRMKKTSGGNIIQIISLFVLTALVCAAFYGCSFKKPDAQPTMAIPVTSEAAAPKIPAPLSIRLMAAGDNLIHAGIYNEAKQADGTYDFTKAYKTVAPIIQRADIAVLNQETLLACPPLEPSAYPMFNSPNELGSHMMEIGFHVFNHANNHVWDKGAKGASATLDFWGSKKAVVTGLYRSQADRDHIRTLTILNEMNDIEETGITVSFLGFTQHTNGIPTPKNTDLLVIYTSERDRMKSQIEAANAASDFVVVSIHWGNENTHTPTLDQKMLAKDLVDWGADLIIGTHPHVLQPVEYIERADGTKGLVLYSLGNFISMQRQAPNLIGGVMDIEITKDFVTDKTKITRATMIPVITHYDTGMKNTRIIPFNDYTEELAKNHGTKQYGYAFSRSYIETTLKKVIAEDFYIGE